MTRKHFQIVADALLEAEATINQVKVIAQALKQTNPRFDSDKFILAAMNWEQGVDTLTLFWHNLTIETATRN